MARTARRTPNRLPSPIRLALIETRVQLRLLRRNPVSVLFTVALPLLLLPLLDALNGDVVVRLPAAPTELDPVTGDLTGSAPWMQYATPAIAAFAVVAACFANLAIRTAVARESGVLKRVRGTPLPPAAHLAGRVLSNAFVALVVVAMTLLLGVFAYGVEIDADDLIVVAGLVLLGSAVFSALGLAATVVIPNADAAPAVVYAVLFPLAFVSNVFYPPELAPSWMEQTSEALPLGPFVSAMVGATTPGASGSGVLFAELAALVGWGVLGTTVAVIAFHWVPSRERTTGLAAATTARQRLALTVALSVLTIGVLIPDERPIPQVAMGTLEELEKEGFLSAQVIVDPSQVGRGPGMASGGGGVAGSHMGATWLNVTVVEAVGGLRAYGFDDCALVPIEAVAADWLDEVVPGRDTGALVSPCSGAVFEFDGTCVSALCPVGIELPVDTDDERVMVTAAGTVMPQPGEVAAPPAASTNVPTTQYEGTVSTGEGSRTATFTLSGDETQVRLAADDATLTVSFFSSSPWLGTLSGMDVTSGGTETEPLATLFLERPVRFLSLPLGGEHSIEAFGSRIVAARPEPGVRTVSYRPSNDGSPDGDDRFSGGGSGSLTLTTTGPLLKWDSLKLELEADGSPSIELDLTRTG